MSAQDRSAATSFDHAAPLADRARALLDNPPATNGSANYEYATPGTAVWMSRAEAILREVVRDAED